MSNNRSQNDQAILAAFALVVTIALILTYFHIASTAQDPSWKEFLQGIIGNIIATTLSFFAIYSFITWTQIELKNDNSSFEILSKINTIKDAVAFQDSAGEINKDLNKNWLWEAYSNRLNTDIKKLDTELTNQLKILEAIRDESKDSDKIRERIIINAELASLKERLQSAQQVIIAKEQELVRTGQEMNKKEQEIARQDRERENLIRQIASLTTQIGNMESSFNRALIDMGNKLKESQEKALEKLKSNVSSKLKATQDSLSSEIKSSIPTLLPGSNRTLASGQLLLLEQAKVSSVSKALTSKVGDQAQNISRDVDKVESDLRNFIDECVRMMKLHVDQMKDSQTENNK